MVVQSSQIKLWRTSAWLWTLISLLKNISRLFQGQLFIHLRNIAKIRNVLSKNDAKKCIHAFVTSRLDYCNALLSGYSDKELNILQLALYMAARILTRTNKCDHITPVLAYLHWLPVTARVDFKVLLLTYKALHGLAPTFLSDLVLPTRTLRSQDAGLLTVPRICKQTAGGRAFSYRAQFLWNGLPVHVRDADSVSTFKSLLKTHLFSRSYDWVQAGPGVWRWMERHWSDEQPLLSLPGRFPSLQWDSTFNPIV